jgi:uncharacterized membrane protein (UPF0127 family)
MQLLTLLAGDGRVVCRKCVVADSMRTRMKGLLGRSGLGSGEGLLLRPANSVHTAFMRFPIDVVFLDADLNVLEVAEGVPPWRVKTRRGARAVLELAAGQAARQGLGEGHKLEVVTAGNMC